MPIFTQQLRKIDTNNPTAALSTMGNHIRYIQEQLEYTLANLGTENFNTTDMEEFGGTLIQPIFYQIESIQGVAAEIKATAEGLTTRISDMNENMSKLTQTVHGMKLEVTSGDKSTSIALTADGVVVSTGIVSFTGMVTFNDLSTEGRTVIDGGNIKTGTISAIDIEGCTFRSILSSSGTAGGEIQMCYLTTGLVAGGIRLDDQGAGTAEESRYRMYIYTGSPSGVPFGMRIKSDAGMSLSAGTVVTIKAPKIDLLGEVYINGTKYGG